MIGAITTDRPGATSRGLLSDRESFRVAYELFQTRSLDVSVWLEAEAVALGGLELLRASANGEYGQRDAEVGVELSRATAPADTPLIDAADQRRSAYSVRQEAESARLAVSGAGGFGVTLIELGLAAGA